MLDLLKEHFGFDQFRLDQEEIIDTILSGKDSIVLMPTGGGKSLCYQLPALKLPGLTLVISPLIALMKDQVDALQANGIAAEFINSSLDYNQIDEIQERVKQGKVKLLYLAPERLSSSFFLNFLCDIEVSLIAIDEAHCISEWGHDFRPDYCKLKMLRIQFPDVPVTALTATATAKVREDIIRQLSLQKAKLFQSSFNRPNLEYHIKPKQHAFDKLLLLLKEHRDKSVIIYCFSRKETENLASDLCSEGHKAVAYHAGLSDQRRKKVQEQFIHDKASIITATIAFGMGIDKPDIRLVVHYSLPKSIEGYYQETGRAGRDGLPSQCVLFYSYGDKIKQDLFINKIEEENEKNNAQIKLRQVIDYCEGQQCRRKYLLDYFGENDQPDNCQGCDSCLNPQENFEATIISQKILSAVLRTGEMFGAGYIIKVLRGSGMAQIKQRRHDHLSVFGLVDDYSENQLQQIIRQLVSRGLLSKDQGKYPTLSVSSKGKIFLRDREEITLVRPKVDQVLEVKINNKAKLPYDQNLFTQLRNLRTKIARERGVPPFIIFGDASLQEMAYYIPQDLDSFANITGVGKEKLIKFGKQFIAVIKEYSSGNDLQTKEIPQRRSAEKRAVKRKGSTFSETKKLILEKCSMDDIIDKRGLVRGTIIGHLEKLRDSEDDLDIQHLRPKDKDFKKIKQAFKKKGGMSLTAVRKELKDKYSYEDLRLARMFL